MEDLTPAVQNLSNELVCLLCCDLPQTGIQFSSLDGSAKLVDVARQLKSSEEAIITSASSDEEGRIVIFQHLSQVRASTSMWRLWLSCLFTLWPRVFRKVQGDNGFKKEKHLFKMVLKTKEVLREDSFTGTFLFQVFTFHL